MARTKGSFNLAGAIEPLAAASLDARATVATKADLTASGSFPYFYKGMETYVVAENKKYRFVGDDPTVLSDWEEVTGGGSGDSSLTTDVTANLAVGAIASGTTLPEGTTFTEFAQKLLITEIAPTTTFTASGSGVKEVGTSVTPTLTLNITNKGTGTPMCKC